LHDRRGRRECEIGRRRRDNDEIDILSRLSRICERGLRGRRSEVGRALIVAGDMALTDPRALANPFVARLNNFRQVVIGHHVSRQIRTAARNNSL